MQELPVFIIHNIDQALRVARASETCGVRICVFSNRNAAGSLGPEIFLSLINSVNQQVPLADAEFYLDCGEDAGLALSVLRRGVTHISAHLPEGTHHKILDIAEQIGARICAYPNKGMDLASADYQDQDLLDYIHAFSVIFTSPERP